MVYTEPQATALLEGSIFIYLHREGHRVNIQNRGYGITGNYCSKKITNCLMLIHIVLNSYK